MCASYIKFLTLKEINELVTENNVLVENLISSPKKHIKHSNIKIKMKSVKCERKINIIESI